MQRESRKGRRALVARFALPAALAITATIATLARPQGDLPVLTGPVNDLANVIDDDRERAIDRRSRALLAASGDAVVVATVDTIAPYSTIEEYALKLFENHGRGIGARGKDNGLLIVVAIQERKTRIEVGYDLEQFITDGFAGEVLRNQMTPAFRAGDFGGGIDAAVTRILARIAQGRGIRLEDVPVETPQARPSDGLHPGTVILIIIVLVVLSSFLSSGRSRRRRRSGFWGGGPWSGWHSGAGPFGPSTGGFGGGFGGFGGGGRGGGGFGGFGGGRSGGGGASGGW